MQALSAKTAIATGLTAKVRARWTPGAAVEAAISAVDRVAAAQRAHRRAGNGVGSSSLLWPWAQGASACKRRPGLRCAVNRQPAAWTGSCGSVGGGAQAAACLAQSAALRPACNVDTNHHYHRICGLCRCSGGRRRPPWPAPAP